MITYEGRHFTDIHTEKTSYGNINDYQRQRLMENNDRLLLKYCTAAPMCHLERERGKEGEEHHPDIREEMRGGGGSGIPQ